MTYKDLQVLLTHLTPEQLLMDVTVYSDADGEYYPAGAFSVAYETDVLDKGHPVIEF
jgi:hypothetical protein